MQIARLLEHALSLQELHLSHNSLGSGPAGPVFQEVWPEYQSMIMIFIYFH